MTRFPTAIGIALGTAAMFGLATPVGAQAPAGVTAAVNPQATGTPPTLPTRVLEVGANVVQNERLATGPEGQAQLLFRDGSTLTLGPGSDITIDSFVYDPEVKTAKLAMTATVGAFRFVGGRASKDEPVSIKTPNVLIGVRGGINYTTVDPQTGTTTTSQAYGRDTTATSTSTGERRVLSKNGFTLTIRTNEPIVASRFDLNRLNALLTGLQGRAGATGGATSPPDEDSREAGRVASANSSLSPGELSVRSGYTLGSVRLPDASRLVAQSAQTMQAGSVTGGSFAFGIANPGLGAVPAIAGAPFSPLTYSTFSGNTFLGTNTQTEFNSITLAGGVPLSITDTLAFSSTAANGTTATNVNTLIATLQNARVTELGGDTQIQFGRLTGGRATFFETNVSSQIGVTNLGPFSTSLASNQSSHYVIGVPATALPSAGSFAYTLAGATSPTYADGSGTPGSFTGALNIAFGQRTQPGVTLLGLNSIVVGLDATVTMPGDATYRLLTAGGLNVTQQIAQLAAGNVTNVLVGPNALSGFFGSPAVMVSGPSRACGSGTCNAYVAGFLAGTNGSRAGIVYALGNFNPSTGQFTLSQLIQGAAIFKR